MAMMSKDFSSRWAMHSKCGLWALALAILLGGCNIGSDLNDDEETFRIRSVNLIEDAATINVLLGDTKVASLDYSGGSAFSAGHAGNSEVSFEVVLPTTFDTEDDNDDPVAIGQPQIRTFLKDVPYTLIAYGSLASPKMLFVEGLSQAEAVADDKVVLQFAHAATNAPQVDVYVTLPQAGISASQYVATLNMTEASAPLELTLTRDPDDLDDDTSLSGDLTIELRAVGSSETLFKSNAVTASEQARILFTVANNLAPGPSGIKIVTLVSGSAGEILERNDDAALRFVHASPDTPSLDVSVASGFSTPFAQDIHFRGISDHINVNSGEVGMIAVPHGNPSTFLFLEEFSAAAGATYSAYAIGPRSDVDAVVLTDDARSVPTQSKFRFLHAAATLAEQDAIDIYLRLPGAGVDFEDDDTSPTFAAVPYRNATNYLTYKEGSYDVYFAYTGTSTLILGPVSFQTHNGDIDTLMLLANENGTHELMPLSDVRVRSDQGGAELGSWTASGGERTTL
jgi:hypothetical protein